MNSRQLLIAVFLFLSHTGFSQVSVGLQGGGVLSRPSIESSDIFDVGFETNSRMNWQAGLVLDVPLGEGGWRFMPELNYANKGYKVDFTGEIFGEPYSIEGKSNIAFLELPFNMVYAADLGGSKLLLGAGPYGGYALSGKNDFRMRVGSSQMDSETSDVRFGNEEGTLKRFDYGLNAMVGFLVNEGLLLKANYSYGLADLSNDNSGSYKNRYFGFTLAFFLKRAGS